MTEREIDFGPSRTDNIPLDANLNDFTVYQIQKGDKVLGGNYWLPTEQLYDASNVPVINEQAYDLGVRDVFLDKKYDALTRNLQEQINEINQRADVVDIVGTKQDLKEYDVTHLTNNDVIKVLQDESEDYRCVYYRFIEEEGFNITTPFAAVFNTDQDMSSTGLSADDYVEVLADGTQLDPTTGDPMTTYYQWDGSDFLFAGCWEFIGYERETRTVTISGTETIIPSDETLYLLTLKAGESTVATINNSETGTYQGCSITFIALTDSSVKYNPVTVGSTTTYTTTTLKIGQTLDLYYSGTAWIVQNSSALNSYINTPYKTYKNPGTYCYFYDGTNITSTYDIPANKGSLIVSWENTNNARALFIDDNRIIKTRVLNSGTWSAWDEFVDLATAQTVLNKTVDAHDNIVLCSPTEYLAANNPNTVTPTKEMNIVLGDTNATVVINQVPYHGYELPITCMSTPGYVVFNNVNNEKVCLALMAGQTIVLRGSSTQSANNSYYVTSGSSFRVDAQGIIDGAPWKNESDHSQGRYQPNNYKDFLGIGTYHFLYSVENISQTYDLPSSVSYCSITKTSGGTTKATVFCVKLSDPANPCRNWVRNFVSPTWNSWTENATINGSQILTNKTYALGSGNASKALITDASGNIVTDSNITVTELDTLDGIESNIQTQLNGKEPVIHGAATSIVQDDLTVSKVLVSDASGKVAAGTIDSDKLVSTDGQQTLSNKTISFDNNSMTNVASLNTIQTLTNKTYALGSGNASKAVITDASGNITVSTIDSNKIVSTDGNQTLTNKTINLGANTGSKVVITDVSGNIAADANITTTELFTLDGIQSNIQTQLDSKQPNLTAGLGINISAQSEITTDNIRVFEYGDTDYSRISSQILSTTTYPNNKLFFIIVDNTLDATIDGITVSAAARKIPVENISYNSGVYTVYGKYSSNSNANAEINYTVVINTTNSTVTWTRTANIKDYSAGAGISITNDTTSNPQTKVVAADVTLNNSVTLQNKIVDKAENTIKDNSIEVSADKTLTSAEYRREVKYYLTGNGIIFTLPNFNDTDCELYAGSKKTIVSGDHDNYVTYSLSNTTTKTDTIKAGEVATYIALYDDTNSRIYWQRDLSDPDPVIVTQTQSTGTIDYENYNQIVTQPNVTLTLGSGDKQGREVSITFLETGSLVYTNENGELVSDTIDANTVQKFKWTGTGWILETQKLGSSVSQEVSLVPLMTSNTDKGFVLDASSEYSSSFLAYNAFSDHPIIYNIGSTIMYDNSAFISNGDGASTYLSCVHPTIVTKYRYLHIIDRGEGTVQDPSTVTVNGITQYTIYGTKDAGTTWEQLTVYNKDASSTDVIIQLNTADSYTGFKIATTGVTGGAASTENIGFRRVQMYVSSKTVIQEITEESNNLSAYTPLIPLMTSNSEKGFSLSQSSTKTGGEAYHAFNQHAITYFIGANGMVNLESSSTNGDGNLSWISCLHPAFSASYGYLHLVDNGVSGLDPEVVVDNGVSEYTIYGFKNNTWDLIKTYVKPVSLTDVKIPLNTAEEYFGFKVCASGVVGTTGDIGWRHIQMYISNKQEIQYIAQVDPDPVTVADNIRSGLVTYYNSKFVISASGKTLTMDNADKIGREAIIIPNQAVTLVYNNKAGQSTSLSLAQNQKAKLTWNGVGYYCEYAITLTGSDSNTHNFVICD